MKINATTTQPQLVTPGKVKTEEKAVEPKDGFVQSGEVKEEVALPKNVVLKNLKPTVKRFINHTNPEALMRGLILCAVLLVMLEGGKRFL